MIDHALVFAGLFIPQCASGGGSQTPLWLQVIQAVGATATTIGVLIALYIAVIRDPRQASEEHEHHVAQMNLLHRAEAARITAHARKVLPSCVRTPATGDSSWAVRIDNASNAVAVILAVEVGASDDDGLDVPGGCRPTVDLASLDGVFGSSMRAAQVPRDATAGRVGEGWPRILPPNQHAVLAYTAARPSYKLRIVIDYEDEAGLHWRRTETGPPRLLDDANHVVSRVLTRQAG
jgi:hypothetical protein